MCTIYISSLCTYPHTYIYILILALKGPGNNGIPVAMSSFSTHILASKYPSSLKKQGSLEKITVYRAK